MTKHYYGFHISPGFRMATVWCFDSITNKRVSTDTCTPLRTVPKHARGPVLAKFLKKYGLTLS